ncbi:ABC transporter substrate-binding protein [Bdellovibrio sp. HCB2-146]|uniref:ABC transporter substrate-binding protein n=1 Tax=Bdellovibrio sp. HCB2-146 TaxID=3394362 RepID=UPI0039BCFAE6
MKSIAIIFALLFAQTVFAKPVELILNWKAEPEFGGFYAAQIQNLYQKYGIDVKVVEGGSGTPTVQMLANGKADFAIVSADEIILSQDRNKKNKVKALFAVYQTAPYIIMTHQERGFKTLKDVFQSDGLLSVQSGLPYFPYLVKKFGKPKAQVVPYTGGVANFIKDSKFSQQGFATTEPIAAEKAGAKIKNFLIADEGFNPYLVVLATTEEVIKKNPELVEKMVRGSKDGWNFYLQNPKSINEHMAKLNKSLDLDTHNKAAEIQKPFIEVKGVEVGSMSEERWTTLVNQLYDLGLIKTKPSAKDLVR